MTDDARAARIRTVRTAVAAGSAVVLVCCVGTFASLWFAVAGTAACAFTALVATYGAYEGFDASLRRGPRS